MGFIAYPIFVALAVVLLRNPERAEDPLTPFPPMDFVEYWSAARVHLAGGDPYDGNQLIESQRYAAGQPYKTQPTMLWTPPWTLPLYWPFGALAPGPAHSFWTLVQVLASALAAVWTWTAYGGKGGLWLLVPLLATATFVPVWWLLYFGQNTAFVLLGVAGFLYFRTKGHPLLAGVLVALTAIKPHLLALFGLAILLDASTRVGRRVLAGGVGAVLLASLAALIPNREVFAKFLDAMTRPNSHAAPSVTEWQLPLLSYRFREWIDHDQFRLQFLPILSLGALLVPYWWFRRKTWDWQVEAPRLVVASLLAAPYGGWLFDLVILIVPVVQAFVAFTRKLRLAAVVIAVPLHLLIALGTQLYPTFLHLQGRGYGLHDFLWVCPAIALWWLAATRLARTSVPPTSP